MQPSEYVALDLAADNIKTPVVEAVGLLLGDWQDGDLRLDQQVFDAVDVPLADSLNTRFDDLSTRPMYRFFFVLGKALIHHLFLFLKVFFLRLIVLLDALFELAWVRLHELLEQIHVDEFLAHVPGLHLRLQDVVVFLFDVRGAFIHPRHDGLENRLHRQYLTCFFCGLLFVSCVAFLLQLHACEADLAAERTSDCAVRRLELLEQAVLHCVLGDLIQAFEAEVMTAPFHADRANHETLADWAVSLHLNDLFVGILGLRGK